MQKKIRLETLTCPSCVAKIEKTVGNMEGVDHVSVGFNTSNVKVDFDEMKVTDHEIKETIQKLGFTVIG